MDSVTAEGFLDTYHNASTPPSPDVPEDLVSFMLAADRVLAEAAELARVPARAHQAAAMQLIGEGWAHARKHCSPSEEYPGWADHRAPAKGFGVYAFAHQVSRPIRLTDEELHAHPEWRNFGDEVEDHPSTRSRSFICPTIGGRLRRGLPVDVGPDQASKEEDGPMNQAGSVAMPCPEAHRVAGIPRRASDPGACGGCDATADRI